MTAVCGAVDSVTRSTVPTATPATPTIETRAAASASRSGCRVTASRGQVVPLPFEIEARLSKCVGKLGICAWYEAHRHNYGFMEIWET
jgi:hypothetical protein